MSWVAVGTTAVSAGAGIYAASKKGKGGGVSIAADPYKATREAVQPWIVGQVGKAGPQYTGEMAAPMSGAENQSMDFLRQYGNSDLGSTFGLAKNEIAKTLNDQYDPTTSSYYQAVKAEAERGANKTNALIASNAAGSGRYYAGARMKQQREAATDTTNNLNTTMGQLAMQERQNKLNVIPQAVSMAQIEQNQPLQKATAFQTLGALPREIQQALDTAKMNEFYKANYDYPLQIAQLANGQNQAPLYQQNPTSQGDSFMDSIGSGVGKFLPYLMDMLKNTKTAQSGG